MPELGGPGGPLAPQYLADQLTLFQRGRANYPRLLLLAPPIFFTFRHHCKSMNLSQKKIIRMRILLNTSYMISTHRTTNAMCAEADVVVAYVTLLVEYKTWRRAWNLCSSCQHQKGDGCTKWPSVTWNSGGNTSRLQLQPLITPSMHLPCPQH